MHHLLCRRKRHGHGEYIRERHDRYKHKTDPRADDNDNNGINHNHSTLHHHYNGINNLYDRHTFHYDNITVNDYDHRNSQHDDYDAFNDYYDLNRKHDHDHPTARRRPDTGPIRSGNDDHDDRYGCIYDHDNKRRAYDDFYHSVNDDNDS